MHKIALEPKANLLEQAAHLGIMQQDVKDVTLKAQ
jgi:hypothetical protein